MLLAFVAHYLDIGADEVRIYMEQPNPGFEAIVGSDQRVVLIHTDAEYWRREHGRSRPAKIIKRQQLNLAHALETMHCAWVLHVDTDEYLAGHEDVLREMMALPQSIKVFSIPNSERAFLRSEPTTTAFDGVFRVPFSREGEARDQSVKAAISDVYGPAGYFLPRGVSGYSSFKSFFRTDAKLTPGIHQPLPREAWRNHPARRYYRDPVLLHFDSFTHGHWLHKMLRIQKRTREMQTPDNSAPGMALSRRRIIKKMLDQAENKTQVDLDQLYSDLFLLSDEQAARLEHYKKLIRFKITPAASIRRIWPGVSVDLSPAAVDAALEQLRA